MLEILNLDKREVISIDQLSDQNVTEVYIVLIEIVLSTLLGSTIKKFKPHVIIR